MLVWVDPLIERLRTALCSMRCCATSPSQGIWVSTHPDVILKMGTKEVLYRTKQLGWGTDTHLYRTVEAFQEGFSRLRLQAHRASRVLKQHRGNGGSGRMEGRAGFSARSKARIRVRVLHAQGGSVPEVLPFACLHDAGARRISQMPA